MKKLLFSIFILSCCIQPCHAVWNVKKIKVEPSELHPTAISRECVDELLGVKDFPCDDMIATSKKKANKVQRKEISLPVRLQEALETYKTAPKTYTLLQKLSKDLSVDTPQLMVSQIKGNGSFCVGIFIGGPTIFVNTEMLQHVANDCELAAIFCHELSHIKLGHIYRESQHRMRSSAPWILFFIGCMLSRFTVGAVVSGAVEAASKSGYGSLRRQNSQRVLRLGFLQVAVWSSYWYLITHGKKSERDADLNGAYIPTVTKGMISFFKRSRCGNVFQDSLSSFFPVKHPSLKSRIAYLEKHLENQLACQKNFMPVHCY